MMAEAGNCITEAPSVSVSARAAKQAKTETSVTREKTEMESYFLLKDYRYIIETVVVVSGQMGEFR